MSIGWPLCMQVASFVLSVVEIFTEGNKDIAFSTANPQWRFQRKLGHLAIRRFVEKERLEALVNSVTPKIADVLDNLGDKPFAPKYTIGLVVFNILATLCFGKQYDLNAPDLVTWIQMNVELLEVLGNGLAADYFPILKQLPDLGGVGKIKTITSKGFEMFYKELDSHRKSFNPGRWMTFQSIFQTFFSHDNNLSVELKARPVQNYMYLKNWQRNLYWTGTRT
jgi:hypothetical protein